MEICFCLFPTVSPPPILKDQGIGALPNKPIHLGLSQGKKKRSSQDSNPSSPNVTITPAEEGAKPFLQLFDSGNNSMTGSDASGHSAQSEALPGSPMINLDSPIAVPTGRKGSGTFNFVQVAEFDPLIRQSVSHDSLLFDPYHIQSSDSPRLLSTSPTPAQTVVGVQRQQSQSSQKNSQGSPRDSLTADSGIGSIARPRPRGLSAPMEPPFQISAPSSRSHSPKLTHRCPNSPTGSIKSQQYFSTYDDDIRPAYQSDSEYGDNFEGFRFDDEPDLLIDWFNPSASILQK